MLVEELLGRRSGETQSDCVLVRSVAETARSETQANCVLVVERWSCTLEGPWTCVVDVTRDWHFVPDPSGWLQLGE